jgi:hypothetical protein
MSGSKMEEESESGVSEGYEDAASLYLKYANEYIGLMTEASTQFAEEKKAIEQSFARQVRIIENYRKVKRETILREGLYFEQLEHDKDVLK